MCKFQEGKKIPPIGGISIAVGAKGLEPLTLSV